MLQVTLMVQKWSCYRGGSSGMETCSCYRGSLLNGGRIGNVREVASSMEGEYSCYGGGQFKGGRMVMLRRW